MNSVELPAARNGITVSNLPLISSSSLSRISHTLTSVALDGPLLVTVIVKVTTSPIVASSESTTFSTVKMTIGVTLTSSVSLT